MERGRHCRAKLRHTHTLCMKGNAHDADDAVLTARHTKNRNMQRNRLFFNKLPLIMLRCTNVDDAAPNA